MNRYDGKPFLRLLDSYVLDAIGQLTAERGNALDMLQPKLETVYKINGTWQEIVRTQMALPSTFPESVRMVWHRFLSAAQARGASVDPAEFVERFVDENFPGTR